ncbi:MAG: aldose 1-epimerase family protein [Ruminococcaceae bacterium]|nr:aldose 1-epimerase family protein [Oscillospiraceae bacterium]
MQRTAQSDRLIIEVKDFGAGLTGIRSKKTGYEFLWQGDEKVWNGQSPILFPIIGRLLDDVCTVDGREYSIIRHGIARHRDFKLVSESGSSLTFLQTEDAETLKSFPFKYELYVKFEVSGNALTVTHTVRNTNSRSMAFSLGAHPAFNCSIGDRIVFEKPETKYCERIGTDSLLNGEKDFILDGEDTIPLEEHTFDKDVMIFESPRSDYAVLCLDSVGKKIKFTFGDAPFFSVWAKPNAPFVCLEPWYGINDSHKKSDSFFVKRGNVILGAGEEFSFAWTAEFTEE